MADTDRELMRRAPEVLEGIDRADDDRDFLDCFECKDVAEVTKSLRDRLGQQDQVPICWASLNKDGDVTATKKKKTSRHTVALFRMQEASHG